jgi:hypothetical protein
MTKIAGSGFGSGSGSISQKRGSADLDLDLLQNVMDPEHFYKGPKNYLDLYCMLKTVDGCWSTVAVGIPCNCVLCVIVGLVFSVSSTVPIVFHQNPDTP